MDSFVAFGALGSCTGLGSVLGLREVGGEGREEVGEIRHFLVGEGRPGGHRGVRHAAPDDVHEVLMGRERSVGSRADLELAGREVARPGAQVRGGVAFAVPVLAVALRTVLEVELSCPTPAARRSRRPEPPRAPIPLGAADNEAIRTGETRGRERRARTNQARGHLCAASSLARGFWPVKS